MTPRRSTGFTLIETIAAIVILSISVPTMLMMLSKAHHERANPVMISRARWLAASKLEDIIADRHSTTRGYAYLISGNYPAEGSITGYDGFSRTVTLNETLADLVTGGSGYMNVTVQLSWTDTYGTSRDLSISTVLTDYTP